MKEKTIERIRKFTEERDWDQFHSPVVRAFGDYGNTKKNWQIYLFIHKIFLINWNLMQMKS